MKEPLRVWYNGIQEEVQIGDWVQLRVLFRKRTGRIVYLPGTSKRHREMAYGGVEDVGIRLEDGTFVATPVHPETSRLKKGVLLVRRDPIAVREVQPEEPLFEDSDVEEPDR